MMMGGLIRMLKEKEKVNKKTKFIQILLLLIFLLIYPGIIFGSDVLQKTDEINDLKFASFAYDGNYFVFTRYDSTGNKYELVFYDLKEKKPVIVIPDLPPDTKYLFSDSKYIFVNNPHKYNEVIIIDKKAPFKRKLINIDSDDESPSPNRNRSIKQIFTIEEYLYIFSDTYRCLIYSLPSMKKIKEADVYASAVYQHIDNTIIGIGNKIIIYDKDLKFLNTVDNNLQCQLGMSGTIHNRLFFSDLCGKIYEYDIKRNERKTLIDLGALEIRSGLHRFASLNFDINDEGILIAVHSNKESYPQLININSGELIKTITLKNIPDFIMIDNEKLYFIFSDWLGKKSKIEIYKINKALLNSDEFYETNLEREYEHALQIYRETNDAYKAIEVLENADVILAINEKRKIGVNTRLKIMNGYAYFLSLTYDRYKEAIPLLEKVISISAGPIPAQMGPFFSLFSISNVPAITYLYLADAYYKFYKYETFQEETRKKAINYYEIYKKKLNYKGEAKNNLIRSYPQINKCHLVKELNINVMGIHLSKTIFWKDKIFAADAWCYDRDEHLSIYVYDRNNYSPVNRLKLLKCDDEQQDIFSSLNIKDNKLYVRTGYRYEDAKRMNFFIFDLNNYKILKKYHDNSYDAEFWEQLGLDVSYADEDNVKYLKDFVRSGKKFEYMHGFYSTNNKKYLITHGIEKEKKFYVYNLETLKIDRDIDLMKEMTSFYLFDDLDKVAIQYFTNAKTIIEIYDLKNKQRQYILHLENDSGTFGAKTPVLQIYKHYLIIAHRRDIIFYDAQKMQIVEVIKNVIPVFQTEGEANNHRIDKLIIDSEKKRLLIFTLSAQPNYFTELNFLDK